ncbi:hypothetical protein GO497_09115 [Acidovorax citrulli]|nr:hypothetical protein [Paracidovorax citrulli]
MVVQRGRRRRSGGGQDLAPWPVDPTTLRINSVSYSYLPIDADILGLDPVRLPPDGRVPIYRKGTYVVVGHTGRVPAATYSAGMTINCGRERLSRVYLVGADGKRSAAATPPTWTPARSLSRTSRTGCSPWWSSIGSRRWRGARTCRSTARCTYPSS